MKTLLTSTGSHSPQSVSEQTEQRQGVYIAPTGTRSGQSQDGLSCDSQSDSVCLVQRGRKVNGGWLRFSMGWNYTRGYKSEPMLINRCEQSKRANFVP